MAGVEPGGGPGLEKEKDRARCMYAYVHLCIYGQSVQRVFRPSKHTNATTSPSSPARATYDAAPGIAAR